MITIYSPTNHLLTQKIFCRMYKLERKGSYNNVS